MLAAASLPMLCSVLAGGVVADRLPRQKVMLASDAVRAITQGATAGLLISGSAHIWQLLVLQAIYGSAVGFFRPAATGLVPAHADTTTTLSRRGPVRTREAASVLTLLSASR